MTQDNSGGQAVAERVRASSLAVGGSSDVEAMLANSLRERKPLADDGALHDTIQAAENAASAFIFVPPGTFNESVTISTSGLTLLGSGRATLIDGGTTGSAIVLDASNVTISNLSAKTTAGGGNNYDGLTTASGSDSATIDQVTFRDSDRHGVFLSSNGSDHTIRGCRFVSTDEYGIYANRPRTKVVGNILESGIGGSAIHHRDHDSISAGNVITGAGTHGFFLFNCPDTVVYGNRVHNVSSEGIRVDAADMVVVNNRVSDSGSADIADQGTTSLISDNLTGSAN